MSLGEVRQADQVRATRQEGQVPVAAVVAGGCVDVGGSGVIASRTRLFVGG